MSLASVHRRRRDLRLLIGDGVCFSLMTGAGEWQFVLFALAGDIKSGRDWPSLERRSLVMNSTVGQPVNA